MLIARVMVMITMQGINKTSGTATVRDHMKQETMCQVLKKGPKEHSGQENQQYSPGCEPKSTAIIGHKDHYGRIDAPNDQRVGFGKHFKVRVLKKLCLPLIMNFFEFHATKIRKQKFDKPEWSWQFVKA